MFSCRDTVIARPQQVAVKREYLCAFSVGEIAQAFRASDAAVLNQIVRSAERSRRAARVDDDGNLFLLAGQDPASRGKGLIVEEPRSIGGGWGLLARHLERAAATCDDADWRRAAEVLRRALRLARDRAEEEVFASQARGLPT